MTDLIERAQQMMAYQPTTPAEMERRLFELLELGEQIPDVLDEINERRYQAEREHERIFNEALDRFVGDGLQVTRARAKAKLEAGESLKVWHHTKREWHYATATERALRSKISSFQSILRSVTAQYGAYRG